MTQKSSTIGFVGIAVGAVALLVAVIHFWAGPFSPQPSFEHTIAEAAVAIKNTTIAALKGNEIAEAPAPRKIDLDQGVRIATSILGVVAIILGVVSFAKREPLRVGGGAAVLGGAAVAFQFAAVALGAVVVAIIIGSLLSQIGIE